MEPFGFGLHIVQVEIFQTGYFFFDLPSDVLGYEEKFVVEISVDYGYSEDGNFYVANVWARDKNGIIKQFLATADVPKKSDDAVEEIIQVLNHDEEFFDALDGFIDTTIRPNY